ncbi:hypothetical protein BDZ97DRAFT_1809240 [Flammula alnicola]|nr:hypothetical protein BDZ97DRAFT_1809240 [Flammula alnicola]
MYDIGDTRVVQKIRALGVDKLGDAWKIQSYRSVNSAGGLGQHASRRTSNHRRNALPPQKQAAMVNMRARVLSVTPGI